MFVYLVLIVVLIILTFHSPARLCFQSKFSELNLPMEDSQDSLARMMEDDSPPGRVRSQSTPKFMLSQTFGMDDSGGGVSQYLESDELVSWGRWGGGHLYWGGVGMDDSGGGVSQYLESNELVSLGRGGGGVTCTGVGLAENHGFGQLSDIFDNYFREYFSITIILF